MTGKRTVKCSGFSYWQHTFSAPKNVAYDPGYGARFLPAYRAVSRATERVKQYFPDPFASSLECNSSSLKALKSSLQFLFPFLCFRGSVIGDCHRFFRCFHAQI